MSMDLNNAPMLVDVKVKCRLARIELRLRLGTILFLYTEIRALTFPNIEKLPILDDLRTLSVDLTKC
jgi:hypothetical protein